MNIIKESAVINKVENEEIFQLNRHAPRLTINTSQVFPAELGKTTRMYNISVNDNPPPFSGLFNHKT